MAADVYRWFDANGTVHYSNVAPPSGVSAARVDLEPEPLPKGAQCSGVRCQDERLEERFARHAEIEAARLAAERSAGVLPAPPKGLDPSQDILILRGMSESDVLAQLGEPDLRFWDWRSVKTLTYFPIAANPFTTHVVLVKGRVAEVERLRRF